MRLVTIPFFADRRYSQPVQNLAGKTMTHDLGFPFYLIMRSDKPFFQGVEFDE